MIRHIILTILFSLGFLYSIYEIIKEWKSKKEKTPYKMKYYALWAVVYVELLYIQYQYLDDEF